MSVDRHPERGVFFAIAALFLAAILLLVFGTVQYLAGVESGISNYRVALQTAQVMNQSAPNRQGALNAAAWAARLNGYGEKVQAVEGLQKLESGQLEFTFQDPTVSPDRRSTGVAWYRRDLPFLNGLGRFRSGVGLTSLQTSARVAAASPRALATVFVDSSVSMIGPAPSDEYGWRIRKMLAAVGLEHEDLTPEGRARVCYPIRIRSPLTDPVLARIDEKNRCNEARKRLPYYTGVRAVPMMNPSTDPHPYPTWPGYDRLRCGAAPCDPADAPPPYRPQQSTWDELRTLGRLTQRATMVCGEPLAPVRFTGSPPYSTEMMRMVARSFNPPGVRYVDFDVASCNAGNCRLSNLDAAGNPLPASVGQDHLGERISDQDMCVYPWSAGPDWFTTEEVAQCAYVGYGYELGAANFCPSQLGALNHVRTDFFITYLKLMQAFLISLSDLLDVNLSVFSAPTAAGGLSSANYIFGQPGKSVSAVVNLFDVLVDGSFSTGTHLYDRTIVPASKAVQTVRDDNGQPLTIGTNLGYIAPVLGWYRMLPDLPTVKFPNLNPPSNQPFLRSGWQLLAPVPHPRFASEMMSYELPTWEPSNWFGRYSPPGAVEGIGSARTSPSARAMNYIPILTPGVNLHPYFEGRYDWPDIPNTRVAVNTAPAMFNAIAPTHGGTFHRDVFREAKDHCSRYKTAVSQLTGTPPAEVPCMIIVATDGKPSGSCSQVALDGLTGGIRKLTCGQITAAQHLADISQSLSEIEALGDVVTFLVFVQHSATDAETEDFLNLFRYEANGHNTKRVDLQFSYEDEETFGQRLRDALAMVISLVQAYAVLVKR